MSARKEGDGGSNRMNRVEEERPGMTSSHPFRWLFFFLRNRTKKLPQEGQKSQVLCHSTIVLTDKEGQDKRHKLMIDKNTN
jgi:hypothetical protein